MLSLEAKTTEMLSLSDATAHRITVYTLEDFNPLSTKDVEKNYKVNNFVALRFKEVPISQEKLVLFILFLRQRSNENENAVFWFPHAASAWKKKNFSFHS